MTDVSDPVPGLGEYFRQFEAYRDNLNKIGFILKGSITNRFMHCGTVGCRSQTDTKALPGPYYEWTRKVRGKTVSVRLVEEKRCRTFNRIDRE
jgi:hypothetical protein